MKKLRLMCALVAFGGLAVSAFADVQNIRISGDIRIRGYYISGSVVNTGEGGGSATDTSFISQRTRVTVEADLEDHVLVVVTLRAEGLWGADNGSSWQGSGAGTGNGNGSSGGRAAINRGWDVGIDEAYVQFNEVFWSAATLKLGRQYLNYGRGLILSSAEQEYNYDAARLVLDFYPLVIDLVGAKLVENSAFTSLNSGHGGSDLLFINARYEVADSPIKDVEAYFGYVSQSDGSATVNSTRVPPTSAGASPLIVGLRTDIAPTDKLQIWAEGAYEFGSDGNTSSTNGDSGISAWLANVGARFTMKDTKWTPSFNANYIYASGDGKYGQGTFHPWFDYTEGYNGYLVAPALMNIQIFNLGASVKPTKNTSLALQGYYYMKANGNNPVASGGNVDFGGIAGGTTFRAVNGSSDVGWEFDTIYGYDYSKDVRCQLVYALALPGRAFYHVSNSADHLIRGEIDVKF